MTLGAEMRVLLLFVTCTTIIRCETTDTDDGTDDDTGDDANDGWVAIPFDEDIPFDLETTALEIRTDSEAGSNDDAQVDFKDAQGKYAGGFYFDFYAAPDSKVMFCNDNYAPLPVTLIPSTKDKVWRITLTKTEVISDTRLVIHCNNVELLDILLDATCKGQWRDIWTRDVAYINFDSDLYLAPDEYRPYKPGNSADGNSAGVENSVECAKDTMTFTFADSPSFDSINLLEDAPACTFSGTAQEIAVGIHKCGTVVKIDETHITYSNQITGIESQEDSSNGITRGDAKLPFECAYERTGKTTVGASWEVTGQTVVERVTGEGSLTFSLNIYTSDAFTDADKVATYPHELSLQDVVHFQVAVDTPDDTLSLVVVNIQASDSSSGEIDPNVNKVYDIVKNGCKSDSTFSYIASVGANDPKKKRFKLKAFSFLDDDSSVFIHADVKICEKNDKSCEDVCKPTPPSLVRKKRDVEDDESEEIHIFQGPFVATEPVHNMVTSGEGRCGYGAMLLICLLSVTLRHF